MPSLIRAWSQRAAVSIALLYPFIVWLGLSSGYFYTLFVVLLLVFLLRLSFLRRMTGIVKHLSLITASIGSLLVLMGLLFRQADWLLFYPVLINTTMLFVFAGSLFLKQSVIEQLARIRQPDLPVAGVLYTRRVTQVWCVFFVVNGLIAFMTAWLGDLQLWALYNGLVSYLLIGLLLVLEWIIRKKHLKTH